MAGAGINLLLNGILIPSCMGIQRRGSGNFTSYFIVFIKSKECETFNAFQTS